MYRELSEIIIFYNLRIIYDHSRSKQKLFIVKANLELNKRKPRDESWTPIWRAASVIHSRLLLLGLIMFYCLYDLFNFLFPVAARGISQQLAHVDKIPLMHILIYIVYL